VTLQPVAVTIEKASEEWMQYVLNRKDATGYHDWQWRDVFKNAFGHESFYLAARAHGTIAGVLPLVEVSGLLFGRSLISLPFVNYGGIVADNQPVAAALLERATQLARERGCSHVELRHTLQHYSELPCKRHKVAMLLDIGDAATLWDRLDRKVRNQIRKAQKSELTHEIGRAEQLDDFYHVFARNMRDLGTPVYPRRLFAEVLNAFPSRAELHIVRQGGAPIAAGLTFRTASTTEVPWASSIREFNHLCPNHFLYWNIIQRAASTSGAVLDFGRSTPDEGTFKFKEQWGAKPLPLCWEYQLLSGTVLPNASPTNPKFKLAISLWQKLPVAVANRVGPVIVRSIP
jgi:serine/alanine adding enzyme